MTLGERMWRLHNLFLSSFTRRLTEKTELTFLQLRILRAVAELNARTQAELATAIGIDAAMFCRVVDKLEADGLLRRCPGADRRCVRLEGTPAAKPHIDLLSNEFAWLDAQSCKSLTPEETETLHRLLEKVERSLKEAPP